MVAAMKTSAEELEGNIRHLRRLLDEADEMYSHLMSQHLEGCKTIDSMARTITAVLLQADGEIFLSAASVAKARTQNPFSLREAQGGYLLTLQTIDL